MRPVLLLCLALLLLSGTAFAVISHDEMKIYAVTSDGGALSADLVVDIEPGNGKIYAALTSLVGTTTQAASRTAVQVARNYASGTQNYDYKFDIITPASLVEGPSAGAAMTLLVISMLQNRRVPDNVSMTGTITIDGGVGPVGGVFHKAEEAARTGIDLFMVPEGEAQQVVTIDGETQTIDLRRYAAEEWGIKVVEVASIDDVLEYAFSDIEDIVVEDVDEGDGFTVFTPEGVEFTEELGPMRNLTQMYITDAEELVAEAKKSMNTTLLEDQAIIDALLSSLSESEKSLSEARLLFERNYFYSAANYAFIARVNASLVKDVADNPSLISADSTVLDLKVETLKEHADSLKQDLEEKIPVEKLEWWISAKQRLAYALNNLEKLSPDDSMVVEVDVEGGEVDAYSQALQRLQEYEYAEGWYNAAVNLFEISQTSRKFLDAKKLNGEGHFEEVINELIVETENGLTVISDDAWEDVERRLNSAKIEQRMGWDLTALTDAASALALVNASLTIQSMQDTDFETLSTYLDEKVSALDANLAASGQAFIWPPLYLDHARYYQRMAEHYAEKGQLLKARAMVENGISLSFLAEHVYYATDDIHNYFASIDISEFEIVQDSGVTEDEIKEALPGLEGLSGYIVLLIGIIIGAIATLMVYAHFMKGYAGKHMHDLAWRLKDNQQRQRQLELSFATKKISREEFDELSRQYAQERKLLDQARVNKALTTLKIDELNNELSAVSHMLKDLRHRHGQGLLTEKEFSKAFEKYQGELQRLQEAAAQARKELAAEVTQEDLIVKPRAPGKKKKAKK